MPQSCFGARCKNQDFEADWGGGGGDWYGGHKGWLAISKLKPLSLFNSLLSMPKKAFDNIEIEK